MHASDGRRRRKFRVDGSGFGRENRRVSERIESLRRLVERAYNCKARHSSSTPVLETFNGKTVWDGVVETFDLDGYATASRCYAFQFVRDDKPEIKIVLAVPGVDSPLAAVRAAIAAKRNGND